MNAVKTRWGSTYNMVERFLEQQQAISAVLAEDRRCWHLMPNDGQVSVLENLADVMKPLYFLIDGLAGEKEVPASAVRPVLKHITEVCTHKEGDNQLTKKFRYLIIDDLSTCYNSAAISLFWINAACWTLDSQQITLWIELW